MSVPDEGYASNTWIMSVLMKVMPGTRGLCLIKFM